MKQPDRFDLPWSHYGFTRERDRDSGPIIAVADDPNNEASSTLYRKQKLTEVFKALERKGWKFTNYEER